MELIYQSDAVPVIPPLTAENSGSYQTGAEWFPIVEPNGLVVGRSTREYCHGGAKPLHPVIHIHIIDRFGKLYLQKRSKRKDIQPGKWDTAVGGHVMYGESIKEALYREADEELGLNDFYPISIETYIFESSVEKEMVNVFAVVGSYELKPDLEEVDEGKWWPLEDIDRKIGKGLFTPNFESEFKMIRQRLLALL